MTMTPHRLVLDVDPGHDDAAALVLACLHPHLQPLVVTSTHGNAPTSHTTTNVQRVLRRLRAHHPGLPLPALVRGESVPLVAPGRACEEIHGLDGLGVLPTDATEGIDAGVEDDPLPPVDDVGVHGTFRQWMKRAGGGPVTLVATGCLTNVALLLRVFGHELKERGGLVGVVWMGGSMTLGNVEAASEFNAMLDPEAVEMVARVCQPGWLDIPFTMVPLDCTHQLLVTPAVQQRMLDVDTPLARSMAALMRFFAKTYRDEFGFTDGPPLHDPLAVFLVLCPEAFVVQPFDLRVELSTSQWCFGRTVVTPPHRRDAGHGSLIRVATDVDTEQFWSTFLPLLQQQQETGSQ